MLKKPKARPSSRREAKSKVNECLVLLSGGIDSAACVAFYRRMSRPVASLFVDYGQAARLRERTSARAVARHYGIHLYEISTRGFDIPEGEIPGRNAFLVFAALMAGCHRGGLITLGIHAGTSYFDCSRAFAKEANRLVQAYTNGTSALGTPFVCWTKSAIFAFCREQKVPIHLAWSCELGQRRPCGNCKSCRDRKALCC